MPGWKRLALGGGGGMLAGMGLGRFSYTAMVPALVEAGPLNVDEVGLIGGFNLAGFLAGAFLSERLRRAVPVRLLLTVAVWVCFVGLIASAAPFGFLWLAICRTAIGVTTGIIMVHSLAQIIAVAPERHRPLAGAIVFIGVGLGILLSGVLVPRLAAFGVLAAWLGIAAAGLVAAVLAHWGWRNAVTAATGSAAEMPRGPAWAVLLAAHVLFSIGIVPHSLYWVDFIARGLGAGMTTAGWHWGAVGVFACLGPAFCSWLALRIGVKQAIVASFVGLAIGVAGPALLAHWPLLALSSVIFGAQPGMSVLLAARVREFGAAEAMPRMMRASILANGCGTAVGGLTIPILFGVTESYAVVFAIGGGAMAFAAILVALTRRG